MHRFIDGEDRMQQALLPHSLEDYVDGENPVRVIEIFIEELDLAALGFSGVTPSARACARSPGRSRATRRSRGGCARRSSTTWPPSTRSTSRRRAWLTWAS